MSYKIQASTQIGEARTICCCADLLVRVQLQLILSVKIKRVNPAAAAEPAQPLRDPSLAIQGCRAPLSGAAALQSPGLRRSTHHLDPKKQRLESAAKL